MSEKDQAKLGKLAQAQQHQEEPCLICGGPTIEAHCKIVCRNCGYTRDCSDP